MDNGTVVFYDGIVVLAPDRVDSSEIKKMCNSGKIVIVRSPALADSVANVKANIYSAQKTLPKLRSPHILDDCKSGIHESNHEGAGYKCVDKSTYFFSWDTDVFDLFPRVLDLYFKLSVSWLGLSSNVLGRRPEDGSVFRCHVIEYPLGVGRISWHVDPMVVNPIQCGFYCSQFGEDYDDGGFSVMDRNSVEVSVEQKIQKGDLVFFNANMPHCVKPVNRGERMFVNFGLIQSHLLKDRIPAREFVF
jgi:hypothetical protein